MLSARSPNDPTEFTQARNTWAFALSVYNPGVNSENRPPVGWQAMCVRSGGGYFTSKANWYKLADNGPHQLHCGDMRPPGQSAHWGVGTIYIWDRKLSDEDMKEVEYWMTQSFNSSKVNLKSVGACSSGLAVETKCQFAPLLNSDNVIHARLHASNWDAGNQKLVDAGVKGYDSVEVHGTIEQKTEAGHGATVPITSISGDMHSSILFPNGSIPDLFTICSVSRWTGDEYAFARPTVTTNFTYEAGGLVANQEEDVFFNDESRIYNRGRIVRSRLGTRYVISGTGKAPTGNEIDWFHGHSEFGLGTVAYGQFKTKQESIVEAPQTDWLVVCGKNKIPSTRTVLANAAEELSLKGLSEAGYGDTALSINEKSNLIEDGSNIACTAVDRTRTTCFVQEASACLSVTDVGLGTSAYSYRTICAIVHGQRIYCWGYGDDGYSYNWLDSDDRKWNNARLQPASTYATIPAAVQGEIDAGARLTKVKFSSPQNYRLTFAVLLDNGSLMIADTQTASTILQKKQSSDPAAPIGKLTKVDLEGYKALDFAALERAYCLIERDIEELQEKRVSCWGYNTNGLMANGEADGAQFYYGQRLTVALALDAGETPASFFDAKLYTTGLITSLGRIKWWGRQLHDLTAVGFGKAGEEPVSPFLQYEDLTDVHVKQAAMGQYGACGIRLEDDKLVCWGAANGDGVNMYQIHPNVPIENTANPMPPTIYEIQAKQVSLGNGHTCIIGMDELVYCWGENGYGQTGFTSGVDNDYDPNTPVFSWQATDIECGLSETCATRKDTNQLYCWGRSTTQTFAKSLTDPVVFPAHTADSCADASLVGTASTCASPTDTFTCYNCSNVVTYEAQECLDTQSPYNNASSWSLAHALVWDFHLTDTDMTTVVQQLHDSLHDSSIDVTKIGECKSGYALPDRCAGIVSDLKCGPAAACPPGQQFDLIEGCVPCPVGTASRTWSLKDCPVCPPGSFADEPGMTKCTKCGWHEYSDAEGATSPDTCTPCPEGSFTEKKGATSLEACLSCPSS